MSLTSGGKRPAAGQEDRGREGGEEPETQTQVTRQGEGPARRKAVHAERRQGGRPRWVGVAPRPLQGVPLGMKMRVTR